MLGGRRSVEPQHTAGRYRRYDLAKLKPEAYRSVVDTRQTVAYARVCSSDQKEALNRQQQAQELYCAQQGWSFSDYP